MRAFMPLAGWIAIGAGFVGLVALLLRRAKHGGGPLDLHTGEIWSNRPQEPGWTETVDGDRGGRLGRSFAVDDNLMTADRSPHNTSTD